MFLYMRMTEMFSDHLSTTGAYPEKFILSTGLHRQYLRDWVRMRQLVTTRIDPTNHMGVPIEISDITPNVMVAADGAEVSLVSPEA
ncbi:hypothetical protein J2W25_001953 [Variovorax boronicumulans]|uniref:Uncharacterized protein n=2 Tax=Variovorax boronicumulans TaxID=436515 RepID=A0AAW8DUE3_9BURK|nr:hypothetical protein [Variovorax boronicumulans]MDP9922932.1 hypothetical protein [Variovorax boronicumulans]